MQNNTRKMVYQYVDIEQIHSISQAPRRWAYPLSVLFKFAGIQQDPLSSDFVIEESQQISQIDNLVEEILKGKEYKVPLPSHKQ